MKKIKLTFKNQQGSAILIFLLIAFVFIIITGAVAAAAVQQYKLANFRKNENTAMQIAEAGLNYYRWHLITNPNDYKDGNSGSCNPCGPYIHTYSDPTYGEVGSYSLMIYPPTSNEKLAKIKSTAFLAGNQNFKRSVQATIGEKPFSSMQLICNDNLDLGSSTEFHGPVHANGGIRLDGIAYNLVESNRDTYYYSPLNQTKNGVWTSQANENNVFLVGKQYPVLPIDFDSLSTNLLDLKTQAQTTGKFLTETTGYGYYIILKNNDTYDLYTVDSLKSDCIDGSNTYAKWTPDTKTLVNNFSLPTNGIIFSEDDVWVEGVINTAKVTIVAAKMPEVFGEDKNIIINKDLTYTNKDGNDIIGLISQNNVIIGLESNDTLNINASIIAQKGTLIRPQYTAACDNIFYQRNTLNLYGSLAENTQHSIKYTGSGYQNFNFYYDNNSADSPAPQFPSTGQTTMINWEIVKN